MASKLNLDWVRTKAVCELHSHRISIDHPYGGTSYEWVRWNADDIARATVQQEGARWVWNAQLGRAPMHGGTNTTEGAARRKVKDLFETHIYHMQLKYAPQEAALRAKHSAKKDG